MEKIRSSLNLEVGKKKVDSKTDNFFNAPIKKIVNADNRDILIGFLFLGFLFVIAFSFFAYNGYFIPKVEQDINLPVNNSVDVINDYIFEPKTTNAYSMDFYPNYTINLYLDKELFNISN